MASTSVFKKKWFWPVIIGFITVLVFINSIGNAFVLDDPSQVSNNPAVQNFDLNQIFFGSTFAVGAAKGGIYYKPFLSATFALIYKVFGTNAGGYHFFQLILHAVNAIIVFYIFKKFFPEWLSGFLALVFSIHPFNSEAVFFISDLQEPLFFLFGSLGFLVLSKKVLRDRDVFWGILLLLFALLSKETGILFFAVLIVYRFVFSSKKEIFKLSIGYGIGLLLYLGMRFLAVGLVPLHDKPYPMMRLGLSDRLMNLPAMVFYYVRNFFFPYDFAVGQHWTIKDVDWGGFWWPLFAVGLFLSVLLLPLIFNFQFSIFKKFTVFKFSRQQLFSYLFFLLWFLGGMLLHLNIFPLDVTVADRWFYFPIIGLLGVIGVLITGLMINDSRLMNIHKSSIFNLKSFAFLVMVGLILVLSVRTFIRSFDFRSGLALDRRDINFSPASFPLESNYAYELSNAGLWDEALVHAKKSTELGPWWWLNWNNLGVVYRHFGVSNNDVSAIDLALASFDKSTENTTAFFLPYENKAELLLYHRKPEETIKYITDISKKMNLSVRLAFLLALAKYESGDAKGALEVVNQIRGVAPNDAQIQQLYGGLINNQKILLEKPKY